MPLEGILARNYLGMCPGFEKNETKKVLVVIGKRKLTDYFVSKFFS